MTIYSHIKKDEDGNITYKKELRQHLIEVTEGVDLCPPLPNIDDDFWIRAIGKVIGYCHDFGKSTSYFQNYLIYDKKCPPYHYHSYISSLWTYYILEKERVRISNTSQRGSDWSKYNSLIGYLAVYYHHNELGSLESIINEDIFDEFLRETFSTKNWLEKIEMIKAQAKNILRNADEVNTLYNDLLGYKVDVNDFYMAIEDVIVSLSKMRESFLSEKKELKLKCAIFLQLLFSLLIDGDKHSAANVAFSGRKDIPDDIVEKYVDEKFDNKQSNFLEYMRTDFFKIANKRMEHFDIGQRIYTVTSPTGSGKTLSSLSIALKMRQRIKEDKGYTPRIVYSLPYTSIIDQNYQVYEDVLKQLKDFNISENAYLLKHHHLAEVSYREHGVDKPIDESVLLTESWESEIIVTTFYQLLQTIIGYRNQYLKKYHQIAGSILILDEVQNIPAEYWPLLEVVFSAISKYLGCYIILLTATKPMIFSKNQAKEWLPKEKVHEYYTNLNRTRIIRHYPNNENGIYFTIDEWFELFKDTFNGGKSYLLLFNTIDASIKVYNKIIKYDGFKNIEKFYLSTNITPFERMKVIDKVSTLLEERKPVILVSTQVVEAGVDLDFDEIFRDLGPIDSIVQTAGRGNRKGKKGIATINITPIIRGKRSDCTLVYGDIHTNISKDMVEGTILEKDFYKWIEEFYKRKYEVMSKDMSKKLLNALGDLRFDKESDDRDNVYISDFNLIKQKPDMCEVFIELDDKDENGMTATDYWSIYIETVINEKDFLKRRESLNKIKKNLLSYVISVPVKRAVRLNPNPQGKLIKPEQSLEFYYLKNSTGFIRDIDDSDTWII